MATPGTNGASESERLIPPEIIDDALYDAIKCLSQFEALTHVLEIGSSAGTGSTSAFVRGLMLNRNRPTLHCIEVSQPRFLALQRAYENLDFVKCHNVSSVSSARIAGEDEIRRFYHSHKTALNDHDLSVVLGWRAEGLRYLLEFPDRDRNGILQIKKDNNIEFFDLVLIDGSEFTGTAELNDIYGAKIICLDDTNAFKCHTARQRLLSDPAYALLADDSTLRNGFSIFCRIDAACQWRAVKAALESMQSNNAARASRWRRAVRAIRRILGRLG